MKKVGDDSPYIYEGKGKVPSPGLEQDAEKVLRRHCDPA
jgi:hypothetical protein